MSIYDEPIFGKYDETYYQFKERRRLEKKAKGIEGSNEIFHFLSRNRKKMSREEFSARNREQRKKFLKEVCNREDIGKWSDEEYEKWDLWKKENSWEIEWKKKKEGSLEFLFKS